MSGGLFTSSSLYANGSSDSNYFVRVGAEGSSTITGDLTIGGDLTVGGASSFLDDIAVANNKDILMGSDISNSTGLVSYTVGASGYFLYPSFVKIVSPVPTIAKSTTPALVTGGDFTVPLDGYYMLTAQISLAVIGSSTPASDTITVYADVSGGSITPINGAINTFNVVPNAAVAFYATSSGLIQQKLTAGTVLQVYHLESGGFTYSSGSSTIGISYTYVGNRAI